MTALTDVLPPCHLGGDVRKGGGGVMGRVLEILYILFMVMVASICVCQKLTNSTLKIGTFYCIFKKLFLRGNCKKGDYKWYIE